MVIDYHNSVIDYKQLFLAMLLSGNRLPYLCNRLQRVPAPIYSNFKFWNLQILSLSLEIPRPQFFFQPYLTQFFSKSLPTKPKLHLFSISFIWTDLNPEKTPQMVEPSKKWKGTSSRSQRHSEAQETSIPSSIPSGSLFSSEEQRIRYTNLFSSRSIIDPVIP